MKPEKQRKYETTESAKLFSEFSGTKPE